MNSLDPFSLPLLAVSGVEFLVVLVLMAISALVNWLQKRKEKGTDWAEVERQPTKPSAPVSWEEELRKMLEGETPATRPPTPAGAPPVIAEQRPAPKPYQAPAPMPPRAPAPPPAQTRAPKMYRGHCEHCSGHIEFPSDLMGEDIHCPHCYQLTRLYPFTETPVERRAHPPRPATTLAEAPVTVPSVPRYTPAPAVQVDKGRTGRSEEIREVISLLHTPRTARQAVIASVILSPPKALE